MRVLIFPQLRPNGAAYSHWRILTWSASGNFWDSRLGKTLHHGIHGLLFALIVLEIVSLAPHRTRQPGVKDARLTPFSPKLVTDPENAIVAGHLFGQAPQKLAGAVALAVASISVDGIVASGDPKNSIAVLTLNGKSGDFHIGQALPDDEKLITINSDSVQLSDGSNVRRIALATYGTPDSEGPAAYAALLHGVGLSNPANSQQNVAISLAEASDANDSAQQPQFLPESVPISASPPIVSIVHISPQATPLEQLQALRAQLIHPR